MVMNPDVDGYTKTLNHGKIFPKLQKSDNLLKTKRMKKKYKLSGRPLFIFSLPGQSIRPSDPSSVTPLLNTLYCWQWQ